MLSLKKQKKKKIKQKLSAHNEKEIFVEEHEAIE
jgi:hypothetical protein